MPRRNIIDKNYGRMASSSHFLCHQRSVLNLWVLKGILHTFYASNTCVFLLKFVVVGRLLLCGLSIRSIFVNASPTKICHVRRVFPMCMWCMHAWPQETLHKKSPHLSPSVTIPMSLCLRCPLYPFPTHFFFHLTCM